jgi:hypothetical protein
VQINAAVESVRLLLERIMVLLGHGSGSWSPHRGWKARTFLKIPRLGRRLGAEPAIPLGQVPRPSQGGHDEYQAAAPDRGGM